MKKIDTLLKSWDDASNPTFTDADDLKKRVLEEVDTREPEVEPSKTHVTIHKAWLGSGIVAAAAAVVLAFIVLNQPNPTTAPAVAKSDALTMDDLTELKKVAQEVNHLFPEGVRWISKVGDKVEIKTGPSLNPAMESSQQIVVRYVVLQKDGNAWTRLHSTDIVTRAGEPIQLAGKTSGHLWTHDAGDGVYALDSQLTFHVDEAELSVDFSSGVEAGKKQEMKTVIRNGKEYKIYQTVMTI